MDYMDCIESSFEATDCIEDETKGINEFLVFKERDKNCSMMSLNTGPGGSLGETITLDSQSITGDLTTLTGDQYSNDYETYAGIESELECMNAEEVMTTDEDVVLVGSNNETESVVPDVEMTDVSDDIQTEQIIYTTANQTSQNVIFQTKPTLQRVTHLSNPTMQVKPNVSQPTQSQSIMIVSPAGGSGASQILKISHPSTASANQLQSLAKSLITAKSADGSLVQMRSTNVNKPVMTTSQSGSITLSNLQNMKTVQQTTIKRPAQSGQIYTKMILTGNQTQPTQQLLITTSQGENPQPQTIKFLSSNAAHSGINSPTKTITLAQAQQMGLLSPNKGLFVNKLVQSTSAQPAKFTIYPSRTAKSPTKILPAPSVVTQGKPITHATAISTANKGALHTNPQKVIIRQSSLKPGTVIGGSPIIRIPTNQNLGPNQVHQIQVPGRQVQYVRLVSTPSSGTSNVVTVGKPKMQTSLQTVGVTQKITGQQVVKVVPLNTSNQTIGAVAPKSSISGTGQRLIIPASAPGHSKNSVAIPSSALSQLASGQAVLSTNSGVGNIVVLPAQYLQQHTEDMKTKIQPSTPTLMNSSQIPQGSLGNASSTPIADYKTQKTFTNSEPNGIRPRKPCNCTKSQCLKLYCDCFANGEFCHMCNCNNCSNNLGNEEERQRAIKSCLERNPNAFRPKIGKGRETGEDIRRHNKGCNCKRSGCLKNYCECYEAKIPCSGNCKCVGCRNIEEPTLHKKSLKDLAEAVEVRTAQLSLNKSKMQPLSDMSFRPQALSNTGARQPFNFLTDKVVEMTCQCLMAQAEEAERNMLDNETSQKLIIEEFGRCLKEIIESAHKAEAT